MLKLYFTYNLSDLCHLFFIYAFLVFSNSLKMIKIDQNMSEFFWIVCKSITLTYVHLLVLFYELSFH